MAVYRQSLNLRNHKPKNIFHNLLPVQLEKQLVPSLAVNSQINLAAALEILDNRRSHTPAVLADRVHSPAEEKQRDIGRRVLDNGRGVAAQKRVQHIAVARRGEREIALFIRAEFIHCFVVPRQPVIRRAAVFRAQIEQAKRKLCAEFRAVKLAVRARGEVKHSPQRR